MTRLLLATVILFGLSTIRAGEPAAEEAADILSRPEYNRWRGDAEATGPWLRSVADWLTPRERERTVRKPEPERRERGRERGTGGGAAGAAAPGLFRIMGYLFLIAAALFLAYSVWEGARESRGGTARRPGGVGLARALAAGDALAFDDEAWRVEADRLLGRGNIRDAYRSLYLGLLSGLHERGRIVFARSRTNWEYVRRFRGGGGARDEFAAMTGTFDEVWYGQHETLSAEGLGEMRRRVDRLLRAGDGDDA